MSNFVGGILRPIGRIQHPHPRVRPVQRLPVSPSIVVRTTSVSRKREMRRDREIFGPTRHGKLDFSPVFPGGFRLFFGPFFSYPSIVGIPAGMNDFDGIGSTEVYFSLSWVFLSTKTGMLPKGTGPKGLRFGYTTRVLGVSVTGQKDAVSGILNTLGRPLLRTAKVSFEH